jgi:hypothetical protein
MASRKGAQGGGGGALSGITLQSSFNTSKQSVLADFQLPQMKEKKSRLLCPIDKLQESYGKLREAACQSNLWFDDLFTGCQKLMHVTPADLLILLLCSKKR